MGPLAHYTDEEIAWTKSQLSPSKFLPYQNLWITLQNYVLHVWTNCSCSYMWFISAGCLHSVSDSHLGTAVPLWSAMISCRWSWEMQRCSECCKMNTCAASLTCRQLPCSWDKSSLAYVTAIGLVELTYLIYMYCWVRPDLQSVNIWAWCTAPLAVCSHMGLMQCTTSSIEIRGMCLECKQNK